MKYHIELSHGYPNGGMEKGGLMNYSKTDKIISIAFDSIWFIVVQYLLLSAALSFRRHSIFVLFFVAYMYSITKYLSLLKTATNKKFFHYVAFVSCLGIELLIAYISGYYFQMNFAPLPH